jgi:hypothetical protein
VGRILQWSFAQAFPELASLSVLKRRRGVQNEKTTYLFKPVIAVLGVQRHHTRPGSSRTSQQIFISADLICIRSRSN